MAEEDDRVMADVVAGKQTVTIVKVAAGEEDLLHVHQACSQTMTMLLTHAVALGLLLPSSRQHIFLTAVEVVAL